MLSNPAKQLAINTTTPIDLFNVQGDININYNSSGTNYVRRTFATQHAAGNRGANLSFGMVDGGGMVGMKVVNTGSPSTGYNSQYISFITHEGNVSVDERMRITALGDVGIGTIPTTQTNYKFFQYLFRDKIIVPVFEINIIRF